MKREINTSIVKHTLHTMSVCMTLAVCILSTGCLGRIAQAINPTEGSYATIKETIPPVPTGHGRLFVYITDRITALDDPTDAHSLLSINRNVHDALSGTFWWIDLPAGSKKITTHHLMRKGGFGVGYGEHSVAFDLMEGETKYCRIDFRAYKDWLGRYKDTAIMVEPPSAAIKEMEGLAFLVKGSKILKEIPE